MADFESNSRSEGSVDLDARVRAIEQYLSAPSSVGPEPLPPQHFAHGTVVHIRGLGSFVLPSVPLLRTGITVGLLILLVAFVFWRWTEARRRRRDAPEF